MATDHDEQSQVQLCQHSQNHEQINLPHEVVDIIRLKM